MPKLYMYGELFSYIALCMSHLNSMIITCFFFFTIIIECINLSHRKNFTVLAKVN